MITTFGLRDLFNDIKTLDNLAMRYC